MDSMDDVAALCREVSNWGRWGEADELGTLNHVTPERRARAASLVRKGASFSLAIDLSPSGPQSGRGRFNPVHLMRMSGADDAAGTYVRDFLGTEQHVRYADDVVFMSLQAATHWDALSHIFHDGRTYNGRPATDVSGRGARSNDVRAARAAVAGRAVLLDLPRHLGVQWLDAGIAVGAGMLESCASAQGVEPGPGDFLLVRTGRLARARREGWRDYAGGPQPGLGLGAARWLHERELAAVAADNWSVEVIPSEIPGAFIPLHTVCLVHMGMPFGEMFDLEALAEDCAADGVYESLLVGPPLPFTGAVGAPANPIALR